MIAGGGDYLIIKSRLPPTSGRVSAVTSISQYERVSGEHIGISIPRLQQRIQCAGLAYREDLFNELDDAQPDGVCFDFFRCLSGFRDDPTSERQNDRTADGALHDVNFDLIYNEMVDLYDDQNTSVKTVASQINEIAKQIAVLNESIADYEVSGETANDLRDERNLLLDQLSGYVDITYSENGSMVNVQIGGEPLVDGKSYHQIEIEAASDEINELSGPCIFKCRF